MTFVMFGTPTKPEKPVAAHGLEAAFAASARLA
jgi:hypothetical protein